MTEVLLPILHTLTEQDKTPGADIVYLSLFLAVLRQGHALSAGDKTLLAKRCDPMHDLEPSLTAFLDTATGQRALQGAHIVLTMRDNIYYNAAFQDQPYDAQQTYAAMNAVTLAAIELGYISRPRGLPNRPWDVYLEELKGNGPIQGAKNLQISELTYKQYLSTIRPWGMLPQVVHVTRHHATALPTQEVQQIPDSPQDQTTMPEPNVLRRDSSEVLEVNETMLTASESQAIISVLLEGSYTESLAGTYDELIKSVKPPQAVTDALLRMRSQLKRTKSSNTRSSTLKIMPIFTQDNYNYAVAERSRAFQTLVKILRSRRKELDPHIFPTKESYWQGDERTILDWLRDLRPDTKRSSQAS